MDPVSTDSMINPMESLLHGTSSSIDLMNVSLQDEIHQVFEIISILFDLYFI